MRYLMCCLLAMFAAPVVGATRVELHVGRVEGPGWQAQDLRADWQLGAAATARAARIEVQDPALPPIQARLDCARLLSREILACEGGKLSLHATPQATLQAPFTARLETLQRWQLDLGTSQLTLNYSRADGTLASEALHLQLSGHVSQAGAQHTAALSLSADRGQVYAEPIFIDFTLHPLQLDIGLHWRGPGTPIELETMTLVQRDVARASLHGQLSATQPLQQHRLQLQLDDAQLAPLIALYAKPLLAGTRADDLAATGRARLLASLTDAQLQNGELHLEQAHLDSTRLALQLQGLEGALHWRRDGTAPASALAWQRGQLFAIPLGAAELQLQLEAQGLRLLAPARLPVLDGALAVQTLALEGFDSDTLHADFDATLEPIDLTQLSRALGWPEFGGSLSGRIPGLHLRDRALSLDGALTATAFDGEITIDQLTVQDPLGVLPRIRAEVRLRRLDLAAITGAFSFGRITGRIDGDIKDLRILGWRPVAMNARLYSTPGDRGSRRISQRAIDNISAIGGGPSGLLSRGALSLFKEFAYARIGWSCVLDNGICRMDGIGPTEQGDGYVLVQGRLLPRIDVIGHTRDVSWNVFLQQLMSVRNTQGVTIDPP